MWNADFELGTIRPDRPEAGVRPEPEPLAPKANLEAIASILAVGVLPPESPKGRLSGRYPEQGEESLNISGRKT